MNLFILLVSSKLEIKSSKVMKYMGTNSMIFKYIGLCF